MRTEAARRIAHCLFRFPPLLPFVARVIGNPKMNLRAARPETFRGGRQPGLAHGSGKVRVVERRGANS
jgi:hypothetical protein